MSEDSHSKQANSKTKPWSRYAWQLRGFELAIGLVISALLLLILLVIAWGDRLGIQVLSISPTEAVHSTSTIQIQFSEAMKLDSLIEHFEIEPPVSGTFSLSASVLSFRPQSAFRPGTSYTLRVRAGALSEIGRELLSDYSYSFQVLHPRIAYMYPAGAYFQNVWVFDPGDLSSYPLTNSSLGIHDFAASPDGTKIAFSELGPDAHTATIQLLDLTSGSIQDLTDCAEVLSVCIHPVWRPDGLMIAYERIDDDAALGINGGGARRTWLLDLSSNPPRSRPLFADSQMISYQPQWSADGNLLLVYSSLNNEILIYDFRDDSILTIPSETSNSFAISPDAQQVLRSNWALEENQTVRAEILIRDLNTAQDLPIAIDEAAPHNRFAAWRPDGLALALIRSEQLVSRDSQVYLLNLTDGSSQTITNDIRYASSSVLWDPTGTQLLLERTRVLDENNQPLAQRQPEIWLYDFSNQSLTELVKNGYAAQWLP